LNNKIAITAALFALLAAGAQAQDVAAGKAAFAQCSACHSVDGNNGVGPSLKGIGGRKSGTFAGFRFSRAMKNSNLTWDEKSLDAYIANPQQAVPGNVMPFSGVADAKQRGDLVAFLMTLK